MRISIVLEKSEKVVDVVVEMGSLAVEEGGTFVDVEDFEVDVVATRPAEEVDVVTEGAVEVIGVVWKG